MVIAVTGAIGAAIGLNLALVGLQGVQGSGRICLWP